LSAPGAKGEVRVQEPSLAERTIARRAAESRATVPTLELTVDLVSPSAISTGRLAEACAQALREQPRANAAYRDGRFELYSRVNLGIVVADEDRYLIPTVFDADVKSAPELEAEIEQLSSDAAAGRLPASGFSGATFTLWNAARYGLTSAQIPVVPPQAAALTAGTRSMTLSCDHRILYGARAAAFLTAVRSRLESAER
jgi:pyruvate dehydrogenase E2 component (dihydrolipoyllysine-residue acetyltransferase)